MMNVNYPSQNRHDFRCGLCQRKNAFHCEHDTPYRDSYLGLNYFSNQQKYPRRPNSDARISKNSMNNRQRTSSIDGSTQQQQQQRKQLDRTNLNNNQSSTTYKQNKKSKSCVIL